MTSESPKYLTAPTECLPGFRLGRPTTRVTPAERYRDAPATKMATIPLSTLVDFLVQKSYHDLTVMADLLPRKPELQKKIDIVQYSRRTRLLFIRLLALVKWAATAESLKNCALVSEEVDRQAQLFVDTADQLAVLARDTLTQACLPNFGLAGAIDVLTTGSYPRLPTCIRSRTVLPGPLSTEENLNICSVLADIIRKRLIAQPLPSNVPHRTVIQGGRAIVMVPNEFKVSLTLLGDDPTLPWRLLDLEILTHRMVAGRPPLVHSRQKEGLHKLVQSRLFSSLAPLVDMYNTIHTFCLSLWLDCLYSQCQQYGKDISGGHTHIEEYIPGVSLKIVYWRPLITPRSIYFLQQAKDVTFPKLILSLVSSEDDPAKLVVDHTPPLPPDLMAEVSMDRVGPSFENLINSCIQANSKTRMMSLRQTLQGKAFDSRVSEFGPPYGLRVALEVGDRSCLVTIDSRMGAVLLSVEPQCNSVATTLEELGREVSSSHLKLPACLRTLRLLLARGAACDIADAQGLTHTAQLALVTPPPQIPFHSVYIKHKLMDGVYMVVSPVYGADDWTVDYKFCYLWTSDSPAVPVAMGTTSGIPSLLSSIRQLIELDVQEFFHGRLGKVTLTSQGVLLKRKLLRHNIVIPSAKRFCSEQLPVKDLVHLSHTELSVFGAQQQLIKTGLENVLVQNDGIQGRLVRVLRFPALSSATLTAQRILAKRFRSCLLWPAKGGWECLISLLQDILPGSSTDSAPSDHAPSDPNPNPLVVWTKTVPTTEAIGRTLIQTWVSMATLLDPVLEFTAHLETCRCRVVEYSFHQLILRYGADLQHTVTLIGQQEEVGVVLDEENPHYIMQTHLQALLNRSKSIALLVRGLNKTLDSMKIVKDLSTACKKNHLTYLSFGSRGLTNIALTAFGVYTLDFWSRVGGDVMVSDGGLKQQEGVGFNPGVHVQSFFKQYLTTTSSSSSEGDPQPMDSQLSSGDPVHQAPVSLQNAAILAPSPSPISSTHIKSAAAAGSCSVSPLPPTASPRPPTASPRPVSTSAPSPRPPGSVGWDPTTLAPLPSVPSPRTPRMGQSGTPDVPVGWSFRLTQEHFRQLLTLEAESRDSPLTRCLGCLSLFHLFRTLPHQDKQVQIRHSTRDHGSATIHLESLRATLRLDHSSQLTLSLQALQDFTWTAPELDCLTKFFQNEVVCPPYAKNNLTAFFRLLSIPFHVLRSCVHILLMQMSPPPDVHWHVKICLTIPEGHWSSEIATPGQAAIAYKGKLLLFVLLQSVTMMGFEVVVPLLYDPANNVTKVALPIPSRTSREAILKNIERVLKESQSPSTSGGTMAGECSLYAGVKAVISHRLYDSF